MSSVDDRLRPVTLKIERAKKHSADLRNEVRAFLDTGPYKVAARRDPATRKLIYFVASTDPVPDTLALIAGDVIQNLVSALDHLAYQLVCADTADNPPQPSRIYFPIAEDARQYEDSKRRKLEGVSEGTLCAIDALAPYSGGNDPLWALHRLNNIEKHRLLLAVGSQAGGINLGQLMVAHVKNVFPPEAVSALQSMNVLLNPADRGFPLTAGFELYIGAPDEEPNPNQEFRFDVALNEPGIVEGKPLLQAIDEFIVLVEGILAALRPRLT